MLQYELNFDHLAQTENDSEYTCVCMSERERCI